MGSFLNVVIHRLPIMMERSWRRECCELLETESDAQAESEVFDLVRPRSRCPGCGQQIAARDNIPVLSYLVLGGKCRGCGKRISLRYPLIEALTGGLTGAAAWTFGVADGVVTLPTLMHAAAAGLFCWYLIALAMIDLDTKLLPDSLTLPLMWFGIGCGFWGLFAPSLAEAVVGAMLGYLSLWSVYWLFKIVTGKEGMGYGDFKLLAALAAWLGWQALPSLILVSSVVGAVLGLGMMAGGLTRRSEPIPFGPFLALAGIIVLFFGNVTDALFAPAPVL